MDNLVTMAHNAGWETSAATKDGLESMIIRETAYARAGFIGNPSDIFNGKVMSLLFDRFRSVVTLYETPKLIIVPNPRDGAGFDGIDALVRYRRQFGYYGGIRLIEATIVRFKKYCDEHGIRLDERNFTIEYHSTIPFGVGLGGSSAIIKAVFSALMRFYRLTEKEIPKQVQPNIILEAETEELDISAGPQDRVVMVYGGLVYMDFTKDAYARNDGLCGHYENMDPGLLPPLFIAFKESLSKSSGKVHNIMRYRADVEHDRKVADVMRQKALLVDQARELLLAGRKDELGPLMSRDFDLRRSVYTLSAENLKMIEIARHLGAHANMTGSGGAAIGTYRDEEQYLRLEEEYSRNSYHAVKVNVVEY
jgi:glucuronokinase